MRRLNFGSWMAAAAPGFAGLFVLLSFACPTIPVRGAIIAYYQFETGDTTTPTLDSSGNGYNANLVNGTSGTATITAAGMFGNAIGLTGTGSRAEVPDADAGLLDAAYTNFSVSLWIKPTSWSATAQQYITGKMGGGNNRGWYLLKNNITPVNTLVFAAYQSNANAPLQALTLTFPSAPSTTDYMNVVGTFNATGSAMSLYVNGILTTPTLSPAGPITHVNGANTNAFLVGASNSSLTASFVGSIDDEVVASDTFSAQKVALIHGLGRLAGVSFSDGATLGGDIDAVLNAYNTAGSAVAGGATWTYSPNVGGGNTIGMLGGTVAGGDAFIVLGADGSGVNLVSIPEPTSLIIATLGLISIACMHMRRKK